MSLRRNFAEYYSKWQDLGKLRDSVEASTTGKVLILADQTIALQIAGHIVAMRQCSTCPIKDIVFLVGAWRTGTAEA